MRLLTLTGVSAEAAALLPAVLDEHAERRAVHTEELLGVGDATALFRDSHPGLGCALWTATTGGGVAVFSDMGLEPATVAAWVAVALAETRAELLQLLGQLGELEAAAIELDAEAVAGWKPEMM